MVGCPPCPPLQLLALLLRMLHESGANTAYSAEQRIEVMRVLGIIGALDPHTHKLNQVSSRPGCEATPVVRGGGQSCPFAWHAQPAAGRDAATTPGHACAAPLQASLSGEGKLELEGVRPLRHNAPSSFMVGAPRVAACHWWCMSGCTC